MEEASEGAEGARAGPGAGAGAGPKAAHVMPHWLGLTILYAPLTARM